MLEIKLFPWIILFYRHTKPVRKWMRYPFYRREKWSLKGFNVIVTQLASTETSSDLKVHALNHYHYDSLSVNFSQPPPILYFLPYNDCILHHSTLWDFWPQKHVNYVTRFLPLSIKAQAKGKIKNNPLSTLNKLFNCLFPGWSPHKTGSSSWASAWFA